MVINCKGKLIDLRLPKVMGILNLTPDSFYDGGHYTDLDHALLQVKKMMDEGADFIDIGAMSSRSGAEIISAEEEWNRLETPLKEITNQFPNAVISIDTVHAKVAEKAARLGAAMINDISAAEYDSQMLKTVADLRLPFIAMHKKGLPKTMQQQPTYENICKEVLDYFDKKISDCIQAGIADLIIDVGFGFGKTQEHNFELLKNLSLFKLFEKPLLTGISRKSMIYKTLHSSAENALNGTTALHMVALMNGAQILRVHDVKEAKEVVTLFNAMNAKHEFNS